MVDALNKLYDSWAYLPVHTPMLDYAQPYQELLSAHDQERVFHLVGRDGHILMLRWDITLFLVKQYHRLTEGVELPLRLSYADSIIRHQDELDISRNEFFQTGVELIGAPGPEGDLEVILLLAESLEKLGLNAVIHIGSRAVFNAAFHRLGAGTQDELSCAIRLRETETMHSSISSYPDLDCDFLVRCFSTIANADDTALVEGLISRAQGQLAAELTQLHQLVSQLRSLAPSTEFRLDLSESGTQRYHSGVVFQAYAEDFDSAIAMGGRYDHLLSRMACPHGAVGFSIMLSKISAAGKGNTFQSGETIKLKPSHSDFSARLTEARYLRSQGKRVSL